MTTTRKQQTPKLLTLLTEDKLLARIKEVRATVNELRTRHGPELAHEVWQDLFRAEIALTCVEDGIRKTKGRALISSFQNGLI